MGLPKKKNKKKDYTHKKEFDWLFYLNILEDKILN